MNFPNMLTVTRLLAVPALIAVYYSCDASWPSVIIFVVASLTDWLDGYTARQSNQVTAFGTFLDPVADKLLVVAVLVLLMTRYHHIGLTLSGIIIISRELLVSSLREWLAQSSSHQIISVSQIAKAKTALQMVALTILLYASHSHSYLWELGISILMISVALSLLSLINYIKIALPALTFTTKQE